MLWYSAIFSLLYINNFINIILSNKDNLFTIFLIVAVALGGLQYYGLIRTIRRHYSTLFDSYWLLQFQYCL
jgi:hypothetical protein